MQNKVGAGRRPCVSMPDLALIGLCRACRLSVEGGEGFFEAGERIGVVVAGDAFKLRVYPSAFKKRDYLSCVVSHGIKGFYVGAGFLLPKQEICLASF